MRSLISVVTVFATSLVGHLFLWIAGASVLREMQTRLELPPLAVAGVIVGVLVIAAGMFSILIAPLGAIVIGVLQIVASLLTMLLPVGSGFSPVSQLIFALQGFSRELSYGMSYSVPTGICLITGTIFLIAGLIARGRSVAAPRSDARALGSAIVAVVAGTVGIALSITGGYLNFVSQYQFLRGPDFVGTLVALAGAGLVGVAVATLRWSALGVIVLGVLVTLSAIVESLTHFAFELPRIRGLQEGYDTASLLGNAQLIGVLLIAAGVALWLRARRMRANAIELAPAAYAPESGPAPVV